MARLLELLEMVGEMQRELREGLSTLEARKQLQ
jgi:hypothetical protein